MVSSACGVAHHCRRKHNNFDVGRGWVQISVLVSPCIRLSINCCTFTLLMYRIKLFWSSFSCGEPIFCHAHLLATPTVQAEQINQGHQEHINREQNIRKLEDQERIKHSKARNQEWIKTRTFESDKIKKEKNANWRHTGGHLKLFAVMTRYVEHWSRDQTSVESWWISIIQSK